MEFADDVRKCRSFGIHGFNNFFHTNIRAQSPELQRVKLKKQCNNTTFKVEDSMKHFKHLQINLLIMYCLTPWLSLKVPSTITLNQLIEGADFA